MESAVEEAIVDLKTKSPIKKNLRQSTLLNSIAVKSKHRKKAGAKPKKDKALKNMPKKSQRLVSISSAASTTSSITSSNQKKAKKSARHLMANYDSDNLDEGDDDIANVDEQDNENGSDQLDDIDDIVVSDYEMEEDQSESLDKNKADKVFKADMKEASSVFNALDSAVTSLNKNLNSCATYKVT